MKSISKNTEDLSLPKIQTENKKKRKLKKLSLRLYQQQVFLMVMLPKLRSVMTVLEKQTFILEVLITRVMGYFMGI